MKELTIEQKAQRYDEAIEKLHEIITMDNRPVNPKEIGAYLFPELVESEDERIRKGIIQYLEQSQFGEEHYQIDDDIVRNYIAWLEKQAEHANFRNKIQIGDKVTRNKDGVIVNLSQLNRVAKKQGEQKPADKVEPKFREGDWVVYCNDDVDLITGIEENGYCINNGGYIPFVCENEMRLWDITDAKVGDVLVSESTCGLGTWYCIFKSLDGDESMTVYCYLARDGRFETKKELCFDKDPYNTKPATKEQRDTLMKAMTDAGYTFDFEKKELKKIVVPKFNVHDCVIKKHNSNINDFGSFVITDISGGKYWYNDRIICDIAEQDEWEIYEPVRQKPAWSEEDEENMMMIEDRLSDYLDYIREDTSLTKLNKNSMKEEIIEYVNWLKSLKERVQFQNRWKPSERQKEALLWCVVHLGGADKQTLGELLEELNKL